MADEIKPPAIVLALAEKVNGVPHVWREGEQEIVIVFKDGRKIKFAREVEAEDKTPSAIEEMAQPKSKKKGEKK